MDISLNASGASQIPFSGQALVSTDATAGCDNSGYYAKIRSFESNATWYDGIIALAVEGSDVIKLAESEARAIKVFGVFKGGTSRLIDPAKLKYTLVAGTATGTAIADSTGVITAGSTAGTGSLTIAVKDKEAVNVVASVEVTN